MTSLGAVLTTCGVATFGVLWVAAGRGALVVGVAVLVVVVALGVAVVVAVAVSVAVLVSAT